MARRKKGNPVHGWVNFDKPYGMTSTQAVGKVRWLYQARKAGHAGTLDPLASGILPIALGDATKTVPFLVEAVKIYEVEIKWGERTTTLDAEGEVEAASDVRPTRAQIEDALPEFIGEISQIPPAFSAIKIDGKRAYDLARAGVEIEMKARTVRIDSLEVLETTKDTAILRVTCGKGTYIRSLARDLAHALGTEGYALNLRRTAVGPFIQNTALTLDELEELGHKGRVLDVLLSVSTALDDIP
ncbi:MAG: tRNA pseudouridine(55) synthase TruB, partial [Robiginitomaculum sp.]|nr:tRNA pseudouridine(55) synthase TruB [Robiginitomaculum sp.]